MTTEQLLKLHEELCNKSREIMKVKNHDYSGASGLTPFKNFEVVEKLGITSSEKGILIRILDKIMRLVTYTNGNDLKVAGESYKDSCLDCINYFIILYAMLEENERNKTFAQMPKDGFGYQTQESVKDAVERFLKEGKLPAKGVEYKEITEWEKKNK